MKADWRTSEEEMLLRSKTPLERSLIAVVICLSGVVLALAITVAVVGARDGGQSKEPGNPHLSLARQNDPAQIGDIRRRLFAGVNKTKIRENLKMLTKKVHVAGTKDQLDVLQWLKHNYESTGMDSVEFAEYKVALSYPDYNKPNTIFLADKSGKPTQQLSNGLANYSGPAAAMAEEQSDPRGRNLWLAYAKNGSVTGQLVYVNYGRIEDFDAVANKSVNLTGKICLMRYGQLFRGRKVEEASRRGCVGAILYSDYAEAGPEAGHSGVWPDGPWLPPSAGQRGSTMVFDGDLGTPGFPSKDYAFRTRSLGEAQDELLIPDIPATPIGYADATKLFAQLDGPKDTLPDGFNGSNPGATYRLNGSAKFQLNVHGRLTDRSTIRNVVGKIYGSEEPDRWIILTNHVDAWTFGSQDPNGGTCIITEVARAFMAAHNATGWRPRRSIMFVSVDAEEFGLIGSTEWVEEMIKVLQVRAVALLNVDVALHGNTSLDAATVPLLYRSIVAAAKLVPNPSADEAALGRSSVYDSWNFWQPGNKSSTFLPMSSGVPFMSIPSSGSDQSAFQNYAGVPASYFSFRCFPRSCYPLYHSMFELDWTVENVVDPTFAFSKAIGDVWVEVARDLADSLIVPFNVSDYGQILKLFTADVKAQLKTQGFDDPSRIANFSAVLGGLVGAAETFAEAADAVQQWVEEGNSGARKLSLTQAQMINDRLTNLERAFLTPQGLPGRFNFRHVVFATSVNNNYEGVSFAGISDAAQAYKVAGSAAEKAAALKTLQLAITQVHFALESATHVLRLDGMPQ